MVPLRRRLLLVLLLILTLSSSAASDHGVHVLPSDESDDLYCDSWRVSAEVNNLQDFYTVPVRCADSVKRYMTGQRYKSDLQVATAASLAFAETVRVAGDGKDAWVFDVDETLLSNLGYYAKFDYGVKKGDGASFAEWAELAKAPALEASLNLYNYLLGHGFQIVIITGRREARRSSTVKNLESAGYHVCAEQNLAPVAHPKCAKLLMRKDSDPDRGGVFKSKQRAKLVAVGYRIIGNSGDQWSDLLYTPMAKRSFKLSNPMYYIGN